MLELTYLALFMNSATARRINAIASAVRRSEKARFSFTSITDRLMGEKFNITLVGNEGKDEKNSYEKKQQQHLYVHDHHSKHDNYYRRQLGFRILG